MRNSLFSDFAVQFATPLALQHANERRRCELIRPYIEFVIDLADKMKQQDPLKRKYEVNRSLNLFASTLHIHLTEHGSIKDVEPILAEIEDSGLFELTSNRDDVANKTRDFNYRGALPNNPYAVSVYVWVGESKTCRYEPTGEIEIHRHQKMQLVCD